MSDWSRDIVEQAKRLPVWARLVIVAVSVCLLIYGGFGLARQASIDTPNAVVVGAILAAWVGVYIVMRRRARKPPR